MNYLNQIEQLKQFRQSVYNAFTNGADVLMNLIDALSSNTSAQSVVELSLNPAFERGYSALFKGVVNFHQSPVLGKNKQPAHESKPATEKEVDKGLEAKAGSLIQAAKQPEAASRSQKAEEEPEAAPTPQKTAQEPEAALTPQKTAQEPEAAPTPQKAAEQAETAPTPQRTAQGPKAAPTSQKAAEQPETAPTPQKTAEQSEAVPTSQKAAEQPETAPTPQKAVGPLGARPEPHQEQKQPISGSQPDEAMAQSAARREQKLPHTHKEQKQAEVRADCAYRKLGEGQSPTIKPEIAAKQPEIAAKQPEIAAKQPELTVKNPPLAFGLTISKEELTAQMRKDRQARALLEHKLLSVIVPYLPQPLNRPFHLFGLDVTSQPRQFSPTLSDRGFVYHPNAIKGNKPVTIGHQYSLLAYLPEKTEPACPPWIVPLSTRRVATDQDKELIGMEQIKLLMDDKDLPFHNQLCALVGDTSYSKRPFLAAGSRFDNLVTIARVRSDRTFYQKYQENYELKKGHPTWYGERFSLKESQSWHEPDEVAETSYTSRRGNKYIIKIEGWKDILMTGKDGIKMHKHPFRLLRIRSFNTDGQPAFKRDLWLIVVGKQRQKLELLDIYEAYRQRYDLEHYFRFGKQKLLMTAFQTPEVEREENWWQIVQLAYTQLWLARPLALEMPRPWEKYLPKREGQMASPSAVQRDFGRIIRQLGTPANPPKVRHKGAGRAKGKTLVPRARPKVVYKGKKSQEKKVA